MLTQTSSEFKGLLHVSTAAGRLYCRGWCRSWLLCAAAGLLLLQAFLQPTSRLDAMILCPDSQTPTPLADPAPLQAAPGCWRC